MPGRDTWMVAILCSRILQLVGSHVARASADGLPPASAVPNRYLHPVREAASPACATSKGNGLLPRVSAPAAVPLAQQRARRSWGEGPSGCRPPATTALYHVQRVL